MSDERIAALERAVEKMLESGGASVTVQDPRVSQVQNWLLGLVGAGIIASLVSMASSIDSLNRNFAALTEWKAYTDHRIESLERRNGP